MGPRGRALLGKEGAAIGHRDAQDLEEVPGHQFGEHELRTLTAIHADHGVPGSHDSLEDIDVLAEVHEVRIR